LKRDILSVKYIFICCSLQLSAVFNDGWRSSKLALISESVRLSWKLDSVAEDIIERGSLLICDLSTPSLNLQSWRDVLWVNKTMESMGNN